MIKIPTGQQYSSVATQATLTGLISNVSASCNVNTTSGFPATPFTGVLDIGTPSQEVVDVTNVSSLTLTITRGVDGSAAQSHSNGATFTHSAIARDLREARSHMDTATATSQIPIHGLAIGSTVVGTSDSQTLSNKTLTSPTINNPTIVGMSVSNPTITGTVAGNASYSAISLTGIVSGSPTITTPVLQNPIITTASTSQVPISVNSLASMTTDLQRWRVGGVTLANVDQNGIMISPAHSVSGSLTGTTASRFVGSVSGATPGSGAFLTGDFVVDETLGAVYVCSAGGSPGTWVNSSATTIAETVLGATTTSVTLSSIPSTYKHLRLSIMGRSAAAVNNDTIYMQVNGDTGTSYIQRSLGETNAANGTTAAWGVGAATTATALVGALNGNAAGGGIITIDIPGYSNATFNKFWSSVYHCGPFSTSTHSLGSFWDVWNGTAAITSITLFTTSGTGFASGTIFSLVAIP